MGKKIIKLIMRIEKKKIKEYKEEEGNRGKK
jgi:hypothetical protein